MRTLRTLVTRFAYWLLDMVDSCPVCEQSWLLHQCPTRVVRMKACSICGVTLPIGALPSHEGRYTCRKHKETA